MKHAMQLLVAVFLLSGCFSVAADIHPKDLGKWMKVTDTRDGEVFYYNTNTIRNVRRGWDSVTLTLTDHTGQVRHMHTDMEAYLKSVRVEGPPGWDDPVVDGLIESELRARAEVFLGDNAKRMSVEQLVEWYETQ